MTGAAPSTRKGQMMWRRRQLVGVTVGVLASPSLGTLTATDAQSTATASLGDLPGSFVYVSGSKMTLWHLASGTWRVLIEFPRAVAVGAPTAAPDGKRVAFTASWARGAGGAAGSTLHVLEVTGEGAHVRDVLTHEGETEWYAEPAWLPDGRELLFTRSVARYERGQFVGTETAIERIGVEGGERQLVVPDAKSPTVSADGQFLVYLGPASGTSRALWIASSAGEHARPLLESTSGLQLLDAPQCAPHQGQVVFSAFDPADTIAAGAGTEAVHLGSALATALGSALGPRTAQAHGIPWDLWQIGLDGTGLTRLTTVGEDMPKPAWSPSGRWLAFSAEGGMYVVDVSAKQTVKLTDDYAGGLAWLPD